MSVEERKSIQEVQAYLPVEQEGLNLSDNANLFPPHPAIQHALSSIQAEDVRGYPSGYSDELRARLAEHHGTMPEAIVTGNGSSDLIDLIIRTFTDPGSGVAYHPPSFSMIPLWARCNACEPLAIPLVDGFQLDTEAFGASQARVGFLCRPNNPTGNAFPIEDVEAVADAFGGLLVVDEAYISFTDAPSAQHLADRGDVIVLRSFSKDAGLAGIRFGYAMLEPELASKIHKARGPFRVPKLTEAIALAALDHPDHVANLVETVQSERERVIARVDELGLSPFPSEANFVLMETPWPSTTLANALAGHGVLVRDFNEEALEACIRTTIGPPEINDRFLGALEAVLEEGGP